MGAFESGSMAQPLTARPEGVTVAESTTPNGGRLVTVRQAAMRGLVGVVGVLIA